MANGRSRANDGRVKKKNCLTDIISLERPSKRLHYLARHKRTLRFHRKEQYKPFGSVRVCGSRQAGRAADSGGAATPRLRSPAVTNVSTYVSPTAHRFEHFSSGEGESSGALPDN